MASIFIEAHGNATRDAELRYTPAGTAIATFGIACNRGWKDRKTDEWVEKTTFLDVDAWGDLAEDAARVIEKGLRIAVIGAVDQDNWETEDGQKRSKLKIKADEVFVSVRGVESVERVVREGNEQPRSGGRQQQSAPSGYDPSEEPF